MKEGDIGCIVRGGAILPCSFVRRIQSPEGKPTEFITVETPSKNGEGAELHVIIDEEVISPFRPTQSFVRNDNVNSPEPVESQE